MFDVFYLLSRLRLVMGEAVANLYIFALLCHHGQHSQNQPLGVQQNGQVIFEQVAKVLQFGLL